MFTKNICSIDIGSYKIKACFARVNRKLEILDYFLKDGPSKGISQGVVKNVADLNGALNSIINSLRLETKANIDKFYVSVSGSSLDFREIDATIPLTDRANKIVAQEDLSKLENYARNIHIKFGEDLLHSIPQYYFLDDNKVTNPLGIYGHCLKMRALFVVARANILDTFVKTLSQSGIDPEEFVFGSYAASFSVLDDEDKKNGCILLDMGSELTNLLIFHDSRLMKAKVIPFGSDTITIDMAKSLDLSPKLADEIKISQGSVSLDPMRQDQQVIIKTGNFYKTLTRKELLNVVENSANSLLEKIKLSLSEIPVSEKPVKLVAVGGGMLLEGLLEKLESYLGISTSIGYPKQKCFSRAANTASYGTCLGLLEYGLGRQRNSRKLFLEKYSLPGILNKLKTVYNDYF